MSTSPGGLVSLSWDSRSGYGYRIETSDAMDDWQPLGYFFGTGGTLSIPVAQIAPPAPQGGPTPPPAPANTLHSAHFALRTFPGLNKTLVAWNQPGQTGLSQALLAADFSTIVNLPLFFGKFTDAPNATDYLLSFTILGGTFHPSFDDFTLAALNPDEAARLAWFTDRLAEVKAAMEAAQANGQATNGVPAAGGSPGGGARLFYRLVETYADSDGDGILDHHERDVTGTDPFLADSDHDTFSDGEEFAAGSDPHDPASTPATVGSGGVPPGSDLPPDEDEDGDTILNAVDADPLDQYVDWERRAFPNFVVLPIPQSEGKTLAAINNKGAVVMNQTGIGLGAHWKPGAEMPVDLPIGDLEIGTSIFSHMDGNTPVLVPVTFTIAGAFARDINDAGVIVGEGIFYPDVPLPGTGTGGSGKTTSTYATGPDNSLRVAIRWQDAEADPTLVHPGVIDKGNWGSILLASTAREINEAGTIRGEADYAVPATDPEAKPPFEIRNVATLWDGGEGEPLYEPEEPAPSPLPVITSMARSDSRATGKAETAALWEEWDKQPYRPFPLAGSKTVRISQLPNGREGIAGDRRLMLKSHYGVWEPALRTYNNGFAVTDAGTVWFADQTSSPDVPSLWNPMENVALSSCISPLPLAVSRVVDVASKDVVIAESPSGNVLLLPVGVLITRNSIQAGMIGQAAHPLDDWRLARDLRVAKFVGGALLASAEDLLVGFDHEDDPDRFRVAVFGLPEGLPVQVSIGTRNPPGLTAYDDNPTAVSLVWDAALGGHATASMLLVTDDVDDDYPGSGIGGDDAAEDHSHKIAAGGTMRIDKLKIASDPPLEVLADLELAHHGSVSITIYPVKAGSLPPFNNHQQEIENDIARTRERLAQVGISLNVTVADLQTFPSTVNVDGSVILLDLSDGLEFNSGQADTPELSAFLTHAASIASDTALKVFYISDLVGDIPAFGHEVPPGFAVSEGDFENIVVICRRKRPFVLAHELGHRLTASGSHEFNANNLMSPSPHDGTKIDDPKRLTDAQHRAIISSTLLDAP